MCQNEEEKTWLTEWVTHWKRIERKQFSIETFLLYKESSIAVISNYIKEKKTLDKDKQIYSFASKNMFLRVNLFD